MILPLLVLATGIQVDSEVLQGRTLRVVSPDPAAATALFNGKTIPLFPNGTNQWAGWMPVPVDAPVGAAKLEVKDAAGRILAVSSVTILDGRFEEQNVEATKQMKALKAQPEELDRMAAFRALVTAERWYDEPFALPARGCMISPFGVKRLHNGKPTGRYHLGLDFRGATGTPVRAPAAGVVRVVGKFQVHGGTIGIDHGQGVATAYLHLSGFHVKEGDAVKAGDVIGDVGATGFATGPHLHWIVYVHGVSVEPRQWASEVQPCGAPAKAKGRKTTRKRS